MHEEVIEQDINSLKEILCRLLNRGSVVEDEDIYYAGLTSIMVLPLLIEIEEVFQLTIPDNDFLEARTLRTLAQIIQQLRNKH